MALHCAASRGHEATVRALVAHTSQKGTLIMSVDRTQEKSTALHLAARGGHAKVCRALLELAPCPAALCTASDTCGLTALHLAARGGHREVACALLEPRIGGEIGGEVLLKAKNRYHQRTALHLAAADGHQAVTRELLDRAADKQALLTATDELGQTALHLAAEGGHGGTASSLLEQAPDAGELLAIRERLSGQTALHAAAASGHPAAAHAVRALLEYTPESLVTVKCGRHTALHLASERGCVEAVKALLDHTRAEEKLEFLKTQEDRDPGRGNSGEAVRRAPCRIAPLVLRHREDRKGLP
ncbi:unnamed protein product [Prorocentrum cordatum]|uniref:Uncharacterized protein n=1 Tax=Prorocentrum cordatum TaxID=2364126 RepID=A0ABN9V360_9DINO|nr:unnamed protein product [Polarella glacialis]